MNELGFAVEPITTCPHIPKYVIKGKEPDLFNKPCQACGEPNENWQCLHCKSVYCSRYIKGHMVEHVESTNKEHCVCISYSDLSAWCYQCDSYITHKDLEPVKRLLYTAKFDEEPEVII